MGSFYTNVTLVGVRADDVVGRLTAAGTSAFVTGVDGDVVVYDEVGDSQDGSHVALAQRLSTELLCVALAALVHDSDALVVHAFDAGASLGEVTLPRGFAEDMAAELAEMEELDVALPVRTLDAATLAATFGADPQTVAAVFEGDPVFAEDLHGELVAALGLPGQAVGFGFRYLEQGDAPDGAELIRVPG